MSDVWVVMGEHGEYSDRDVWVEAAFASESAAQAYCNRISAAARDHAIKVSQWLMLRNGPEPVFSFAPSVNRITQYATYTVEKIPMLVPHHAADGSLRHFCTANKCPDLAPVTSE